MNKQISETVDIKDIVRAIKKKEIRDFYDVPQTVRNDSEIVAIERKLKMRTTSKRGFDVIKQQFFVKELVNEIYNDEIVQGTYFSNFDTFDEYYEFLDGDIYEDACYYQYHFTEDNLKKYDIDLKRINVGSFVKESIDKCLPEEYLSLNEVYKRAEEKRKNIKRWLTKYNKCETVDELINVNEHHRKSSDSTGELFYLWNYISTHAENAFDVIMDFISVGNYPAYVIEDTLPFIFDHFKILNSYKYITGSKASYYKNRSRLKKYIEKIESEGYSSKIKKYYDENYHFYCIKTEYYCSNSAHKNRPDAASYLYFENFQSFVNYLHGDLSDCDLRYAHEDIKDELYVTNCNTILPINDISKLTRIVKKYYDRNRQNFVVYIDWQDTNGNSIFHESRTFNYFFDFVSFLDGDLSNADLLYCDGLACISDFSGISFKDAVLTSGMMDIIGLNYSKEKLVSCIPINYKNIIENEQKSALALSSNHPEYPVMADTSEGLFSDNKVYYISDIHLIHKLLRKKAKTWTDVERITQELIDDMLQSFDSYPTETNILLVGGDVSSEFIIFDLFIKLLRKSIDRLSIDVTIVFVLGNHELWNQEGKNLDEIVQKYRDILISQKMYLLHDEILFLEDGSNISFIRKDELLTQDEQVIRNRLRKARTIIFGGIGFAGCNESFNATSGIYQDVINRDQEKKLSLEFNALYEKVEKTLCDQYLIVFTHMNINEWRTPYELHDKWIYVSGHSHVNAYYDDGLRRMCADNQVGYYNDHPHLKYFLIDNSYNLFIDYEDGIYEISRKEYIEYYRGKNILISYNREPVKIYMLKKRGYYCFIQQNKEGKLSMLNGGALKSLSFKNIDYYYQNMYEEIQFIKTPLMKYQEIQERISSEIKKLGGSGRIHGAIIDIDGIDELSGWNTIAYNHVYVNPIDMTITPYYALDMTTKYVYSSFPALIFDNCPKLYANYEKYLSTESTHSDIITPVKKEELETPPVLYTDTDIYKASRELRKMQKLNMNILSTWIDNIPNLVDTPQSTKSIIDKSKYIGETRAMACGMKAEIIGYNNYRDMTVKFEDGAIVDHVRRKDFNYGLIWNPNIAKPAKKRKQAAHNHDKNSYVGRTNMMNCGMTATVIEDYGCNDITIQFEDGLIRCHKRRDKFREGKIAHVRDEKTE